MVTAELQGAASPLGLNPGLSALCADAFLCLFCSQCFHEFQMLRTGDRLINLFFDTSQGALLLKSL